MRKQDRKMVYKKVKIAKPHCDTCGNMLTGNGSVILPYRCSCGRWGYDHKWGTYIIEEPDESAMWICEPCGKKYGDGVKRNYTLHEDKCELCGKVKLVTHAKDFGYIAKLKQ